VQQGVIVPCSLITQQSGRLLTLQTRSSRSSEVKLDKKSDQSFPAYQALCARVDSFDHSFSFFGAQGGGGGG
jgi:hypothetical protein